MKQSDSESDKAAKTTPLVRAVAALGRFILTAGRSIFSMLGGMSLLLGEVSSSTAKGLFISEQRKAVTP